MSRIIKEIRLINTKNMRFQKFKFKKKMQVFEMLY